jgi:hypothetical protein
VKINCLLLKENDLILLIGEDEKAVNMEICICDEKPSRFGEWFPFLVNPPNRAVWRTSGLFCCPCR